MEMRINSKKVRYGTSQQHTDESLDYPSSPPAWLITKILELIEKKYLKAHNPSGPDEENKFQEFMAELGLEIADTFLGSLVITLKINSLQILENLWKVYCSGYLGKKVQSCLATDYVLNKLNLRELQLETTIRREDYEACRRHFIQSLGKFFTIFLTLSEEWMSDLWYFHAFRLITSFCLKNLTYSFCWGKKRKKRKKRFQGLLPGLESSQICNCDKVYLKILLFTILYFPISLSWSDIYYKCATSSFLVLSIPIRGWATGLKNLTGRHEKAGLTLLTLFSVLFRGHSQIFMPLL